MTEMAELLRLAKFHTVLSLYVALWTVTGIGIVLTCVEEADEGRAGPDDGVVVVVRVQHPVVAPGLV